MSIIEKKRQALEKRANGGEARAQYELGLSYYRGDGVEKDMPMARHWLGKAAAQGDRDAQVLLSLRGMQLNQGVEFKFGKSAALVAVHGGGSKEGPVDESELYTSEPKKMVRGADELKQGLREAMAEAEHVLPGREPLRDRIIVGLASMLKSVETRRMPAKGSRGQMVLAQLMEQGLGKYEGVRFANFKRKIIELGEWFEAIELEPPMIVKPIKVKPGGDKYEKVTAIADQIEAEMRAIEWWSETEPTEEQMDFKAAFGMDTMPFGMWIQFVLLPRVRSIVKERGAFPGRSMVGAHAVRELDGMNEAARLISLLSRFDETVEGG